MKSFAIITFGCRLNQAESAQTSRELLSLGLVKIEDYIKADLVLVNTCTITHKADKEVRQMIRRVKRKNKQCFLILLGCWVQKMEKAKLKTLNLDKFINLSVKNKQKQNIKKWLPKKFITKTKIQKTQKNKTPIDKYHNDKKALIKIQTGCSNFCTYCIVPYVRGKPSSESVDKVLKQIKQEVKEGVEEVLLTGVDLGSYKFIVKNKNLKEKLKQLNNKIENDLALLLQAILLETKIKKISFGSMSLKVFDNDFFKLYKTKQNQRLTKHFHIPLQSGSDTVLKRMQRPYSVNKFLKTIKKLKNNIKNVSMSTDMIVGFPNETQEEFKQTTQAIKKLKKLLNRNFNKAHIFRYSYRKDTLAAKMIDSKKWNEINPLVKKARARELVDLFN